MSRIAIFSNERPLRVNIQEEVKCWEGFQKLLLRNKIFNCSTPTFQEKYEMFTIFDKSHQRMAIPV